MARCKIILIAKKLLGLYNYVVHMYHNVYTYTIYTTLSVCVFLGLPCASFSGPAIITLVLNLCLINFYDSVGSARRQRL